MRRWIALPVFLWAVLQTVESQCDLSAKKMPVPFPDIEKLGIESYQLTVEYTVPESSQTDYYTEYYDILDRKGRVDGHQAGKTLTYIYRTGSWEAWELKDQECKLKNITDTQELLKDVQTDWLYLPSGKPERRTFGPSAMFKIAYDLWNDSLASGEMAYMGPADALVRGIKALYWRRCDGKQSYVDYYFAADDVENPTGLEKIKRIPLRVYFGGVRPGRQAQFAKQQYDIVTFQPFISTDVKPFQLPIGRGCKRGYLPDAPELPNFSKKNLMFHAEAIYRKIDFNGEDTQFWSYFSTLRMALDLSSQHLAYFYTPWDTSSDTTAEPDAKSPDHIIFDMKHGYIYKTSEEDGKCQIIRGKDFVPKYTLPEDGGSISLTDPSILYPNNELTYITEGTNRGLKVNIFEEIVEGYLLDKKNDKVQIPKAIITHSYLQNDVVERGTTSVKNSLVQVQLRFTGRYTKTIEVLTFNFFGFSTELKNRRSIFNIKRCFKNDDDYVWVTLGFNADPTVLQKVQNDVPNIQANILNSIQLESELNAARIPIVEVDFKDEGLFVTLMILGKPPVLLDYLAPEVGKKVTGSQEVEGVSETEDCATKCLETQTNCWGFSMCGGLCTFGSTASAGIGSDPKCKLYRRYNNATFVPSKELMIQNLRREVDTHMIKLMLRDNDDKMIQIEATSIEVNDPGEDDRLFNRMGNKLNPRMRILKAGYKFKPGTGSAVKNMGKLRYDECQRLCVDFRDCETVSYCLTNSECVLSGAYGDDISAKDMEEDNMCNIVTRKYADNFERSSGNVLTVTAKEVLDLDTVEKCAKACLKQTSYKCLSFDHCPSEDKGGCKLHTVHYPSSKTREDKQTRSTNCGHYFRKFSTEFKKNPEKRTVGSKLPPLSNLTLEDCSKSCMEYGKGTCFGFDFCQGSTILATSCILLDTDPSQLKMTDSETCTNYLRTESQFAPRPYSNSYAGGIGFLCFLIGAIVGSVIVFGIAYMKVNRR